MYALLEIIKCCVVRNLFVSSTILWILGESRVLLGIGTRLGVSSDGELKHTYASKGETMSGYSDWKDDDDFRHPRTPVFLPVFLVFFGFLFLLSCICFCIVCKKRQRQLWQNIEANPTRPAFEIYPPVNRQEPGVTRPAFEAYPPVSRQEPVTRPTLTPTAPLSTPAGINDVPPNYRAVVQPVIPSAPNYDDSYNAYPEVIAGKTLETPPPAYSSVVQPPFK